MASTRSTLAAAGCSSTAWENAQTLCRRSTSASRRAARRGGNPCDPAFNMFTTTTIPGAPNGDLTNARAHFAQLTGRITEHDDQVALDPATNQYVPNGPRRREGGLKVYLGVRPGRVANVPDRDAAGRLGGICRRRSTRPTTRCRRCTFDSICGLSGPGAEHERVRQVRVLQPQNTRRGPRVHPAQERHERLRDGLEQRRAEHQPGVAAERAERLPAHDPRRSRAGHPPRRLLACPYERQGLACSLASTAATRAARSHHPQRRQRQPGERRRNLAAALQREEPPVSRRPSRPP